MANFLKINGAMSIAGDADSLFENLANDLMIAALRAVKTRGVFHVALSGGGTPEPFYRRMVTDPMFRGFPWERSHIWIVDERRVPSDHEKSNEKMIREALSNHVPIKARHVHAMPVMESDPATMYEAELCEFVLGVDPPADGNVGSLEIPRLDFVLLGMGGDTHTASLFPNTDAIGVTDRWIVVNEGPNVTPPDRVTMTYPLLNATRAIGVLLVGAGKYAALKRISDAMAAGTATNTELPISGIDPKQGSLVWYLDEAAATGESG